MEYQKDIFSSQVLATYDYDKFKLIKGNRRIDNNNLKRLIQSMKERDMKIPIVVTNDYKVIDGQHRLTARRQLQLPVYFIINNEAEGVIDDVILATMAGMPVTIKNIAEYRAANGETEYVKLAEYCDKYGIPIYTSINLLWHGGLWVGSTFSHKFKLGFFECKHWGFAIKVGEYIQELYNITNSDIIRLASFVQAIIHVMKIKNFDKDRFLIQMQRNKHLLERKATRKQYQDLINDIYNYRAGNKNKVNLRAV